jgi:hypothetical protein
MYLPQSVPLARPHVAIWFGRSGKRYDFAVSRARPMWLGQPVVYVLVRYDGETPVPLFVGRATASDPQLGGAGSEAISAWEQAMALGMTHVHLRFEACTEHDRAVEVEDLVAALRPPLNAPEGALADREDAATPAAPAPVAGESVADLAPMSTEAPAAMSAHLPNAAATARLGWRGGWLGRTAAAFASRYHGWRRNHPAVHAAVPAEAAAGRVTVRADAVVIDEVQGESVAPVVEAPAAGDPPAVEPTPVIAEPTAERGEEPSGEDPRASVRGRLGLGGDDVVVLFAGELDWASGADLAIDAMATVHADAAAVRLVLVGEGPLRAELESRAQHGGFAHACRFLGDLPAEAFAELFAVCDAVTIPARSGQNPTLAEHGLSAAKPVLTTHQAGLSCVRHGENGLVAYDNPGSVVWGLRELGAMVLRARAPAAALAA